MNLGQHIARLRDARGWTQAELAAKVQTSERYIGHIETGRRRPKFDKIVLLADAFGIPRDELIQLAYSQPQEAAALAS